MPKIFISYHHANDQDYKEELASLVQKSGIFEDCSVRDGDIPENGIFSAEAIRRKIRDEYLKDTTVTILLVGEETSGRKHVDWEIHLSMLGGEDYTKSGILVVNLPSIEDPCRIHVAHSGEKEAVYPEFKKWCSGPENEEECRRRHPYAPDRIIDNLVKPEALISVTNWSTCQDLRKLQRMIELADRDRDNCKYNNGRPLRRNNAKSKANKTSGNA